MVPENKDLDTSREIINSFQVSHRLHDRRLARMSIPSRTEITLQISHVGTLPELKVVTGTSTNDVKIIRIITSV